MTTDPTAAPDLEAPPGEPAQDPDWTARCRRRLRAALEELGKQADPIKISEVQDLAAAREPLNDYDASLTSSGAVRAWNNLGWNLTTTYEHAGWLHATSDGGFRLSRQGREALETYPDPMDLYDAGVQGYRTWDAARNETLPDLPGDPSADILHAGPGAAHAMRACAPVLEAWRTGGSAFSAGQRGVDRRPPPPTCAPTSNPRRSQSRRRCPGSTPPTHGLWPPRRSSFSSARSATWSAARSAAASATRSSRPSTRPDFRGRSPRTLRTASCTAARP